MIGAKKVTSCDKVGLALGRVLRRVLESNGAAHLSEAEEGAEKL